MASGSSAQANSGTKGFDFSTDDIFYSYEGYENQESTNGSNSNPAGGTNSTKDSIHQDLTAIVDKSMKKHCENIVRFLEGLGSRLSQLELYCYNVEKSVGEMRHEMTGDHSDTEIKFEALDEHIHEVHRSVQILRDKQELADTEKELEKLQLAQKETSSHGSQASEDKSSASASDSRKTEIQPNGLNQQLALILPHQQQLAQQQQSFPLPTQNVPQMQNYYLQHTQIPNQSTATQIHYVACDPEGRTSQMQDMPRVGQSQMNQTQNMSPYPQYQQQWSQQLPHPMQPPLQQQQSSLPPQMRAPSLGQATNPPPQSQETLYSSSMQMPMQYSGVPVPVTSRVDSVPYGYSAQGRIVQQQQPIKGAFGQQTDHGYASSTLPPSTGYLIYDSSPQQGHFSQKITQPAT